MGPNLLVLGPKRPKPKTAGRLFEIRDRSFGLGVGKCRSMAEPNPFCRSTEEDLACARACLRPFDSV
jgi:hypothetical protein